MLKYQLFSEFCNREIYGENPIDAVNRQKTFPRPPHQEGEKEYGIRMIANMVPSDDLVIDHAIEIEEHPDSRRGGKEYITVLAETPDKKIIGIDMVEIKVGRPPVGSETLLQLTVPADLKSALEAKAAALGLSLPDARREAYRQFIK